MGQVGHPVIAITIDASQPVAALRLLLDNLGDLTEPLTKVLDLGLSDARAEIGAQGGLFGSGWSPMSPWTPIVAQALYGKERTPGTLLEDTGRLLGSLEREGAGNVFHVGKTEGEAGTDAVSRRSGFPLGVGMQFGTSRTFHVLQGEGFSETGIPPRQFLSWHESRSKDYVGIFAEHIMKGIEGGGSNV